MNRDRFDYPLMTIGIIGGGQLGKMMAQKARKMGFDIVVLDPTPGCPAAQVATKQIVGNFRDETRLKELVEESDVATYDIEHVETKTLKELFDKGHKIYPSPYLLDIIQDKLKQRDTLHRSGIPVPRYQKVESLSCLKEFGFPAVQKARKGGYDGRGVAVLREKDDLKRALKVESLIEEFVEFEKELAVMVARNTKGEIKCYPTVEMIFDERANICDMVIAPARIQKEVAAQAQEIAVESVKALDGVGIFGIEMFLVNSKVLVNEIAPRPHNSGHYTIEACSTCQFEQHIRAITGLPLGSTRLLSAAVMVNLLGEEGYEGEPVIEGLHRALSLSGLSFHFYGKKLTRPFRKMGHITILDEDVEMAIDKAQEVKSFLKVKAR